MRSDIVQKYVTVTAAHRPEWAGVLIGTALVQMGNKFCTPMNITSRNLKNTVIAILLGMNAKHQNSKVITDTVLTTDLLRTFTSSDIKKWSIKVEFFTYSPRIPNNLFQGQKCYGFPSSYQLCNFSLNLY